MTWLAELRIPATTASLRTVRLVIGGATSTLDLGVDALEDLQMAAAECAAVLATDLPDDAVMVVEVEHDAGVVQVRGVVDTDLPAVEVDELALLVLKGTVDDFDLHPGPGPRSFGVRLAHP